MTSRIETNLLTEELARAEARFRLALEAAPNGMLMVDSSGKIVLVNKQAEILFGYPREELIGKPIELLVPDSVRALHPSLREGFIRDPKTRAMGAGRDLTARRKDGSEVPVEIGLNPFETESGMHVMASIVDITERKRSAAALELRSQELSRSFRDLETILYVATHDLKEPLNAILSFSRIVSDRYAGQLDEKGRNYLQRISGGAERLGRLLDDLLVLTRAQRFEVPAERIEGADVVREAMERFQEKIQESGARIKIEEKLPRFRVHRTWAVEAIANLLSNALKFTPPATPPDLEIASYDGPEGTGIAVKDRGPSVAPELRERIFVLFQRGVGREIEGTGAGLAIVRQIAERHGGRAWMQPRAGGGSEFIVTFGRKEGEQRAMRILVVDDDDNFPLMLQEDFREHGIVREFAVAADGVEALEYLRRQGVHRDAVRPDIILLDINMPRMNGFEVLVTMRADPDFRNIPVAVVTSSSRKEDEAKSIAVGANAFFTKPLSIRKFMAMMDQVLV
ncbi:MAG: PAS domain S-box protein [Candidatus Hydrogenedentota bacterium]